MGFGCEDPSLTYLNRFGYNVVKLPRVGIEPLLVLGRDRSLTPLGSLDRVWKSTSPKPEPGNPARAAIVEGQSTSKLDLSVGLKILSGALAAFGVSTPSLELAFKKAKKVQFRFTNVWAVGIPPFEIGQYLASGDLDLANPVVAQFFDDENSTGYIVTEVLKSDTVSMTASDGSGVDLGIDVPAIATVVGGSVKVAAASDGSAAVDFQGKELVTFGFVAMEIAYTEGHWGVRGVEPSQDMAFGLPAGAAGAVIFNPGGLVRL
jgi:hypothetical protein